MEGLCRGWGKVGLDQTGACLPSRRPLPRQGSLPGTRNSGDLSGTRPNFAGGRSRPPNRRLFTLAQIAWPQTGACLPSRKLHGPKQAPVYPRADCRTPNRRLFTLAQIAWPQTGACLPSRKLRSGKQAPVYPYTTQHLNDSTSQRLNISTTQPLNN